MSLKENLRTNKAFQKAAKALITEKAVKTD